MKRKLLISILVVITCIVCAFGIAACKSDKPNDSGNGQGTIQTPPEEKPDDKDNPTDVFVTGVTLNKTTLSLEVGDSETLTATVAPSNATDKTVTWKSSDSSVAKVENGKVTALKAGTATITATAGGKDATCEVTVKHTHILTPIVAKDADCETAGNTAYYTCACGKWFSDSAAKNEITDKSSVTIKATGHSYSTEWTSNETQHWHKTTCKHTSLTSTPQNHTFENGVCSVCGYINDLLVFKTLEVNDDTVYGKVSNATTDFSFIKEVTAGTNVTYTVCTDKACKNIIPSKTVDLKIGDNVFYVLAVRGNDIKLYTVTLRRRPIHTVAFNSDGGSYIEPQKIEEDCNITQIGTPLKTGYTFSNWKVGDEEIKLPFTVTETLTFNANYMANEYNVVFELSEGDTLETLTAKTTYGEKNTFPVPKNKSYSFEGWYYNATKITDSQGNMISEWNIDEDVSLTSKNKSIFNIVNGTITGLTSEGKQFTEIEILPEINGKEIISIDNGVFGDCSSLESITIPFVGANKGGRTNTYFGYIFGANEYRENDNYTPKSLKDVFIIEGIASIGNYAFYGCSGLTSITIPDSVTSIGDYAFSGCSGLTSVTIPDSVTSIGNSAFYGCSSLTSVTIDTSVTSIGNYAFDGCSSLATVNWNATACTKAGDSSNPIFNGCTKLTTVNIGKNVVIIPSYAFSGCSSLVSITIPDSVTSIGSQAFQNCSGLTSISIPDSVTSVGDGLFYGCNNLISVKLSNNITSLPSYSNYNQGVYDYFGFFANCSSLTSVTIPDGVTSIGDSAFRNCSGLTSITIGKNVTFIGGDAFRDCSELTEVIWNAENCAQAGSYSSYYGYYLIFVNCTKFSTVTIGENVKIIPDYTFSNCRSLKFVTIPNSVTTIGGHAFDQCVGLTSIIIPDSVTTIGNYAFAGCSVLTSLNIPDSVKSIGNYAFYNCNGLTNITFPNIEIIIGDGAFGDCDNLTNITIPGYVAAIDSVFYVCDGLTSVKICDGATAIGEGAFSSCEQLTSITIPDSVTSIGGYAFCNCSVLTEINYGGTKQQWDSISKGNYWNDSTGNYTIHCTDGDIAKS